MSAVSGYDCHAHCTSSHALACPARLALFRAGTRWRPVHVPCSGCFRFECCYPLHTSVVNPMPLAMSTQVQVAEHKLHTS
jgi:hypothetical protein